MDFRVSCACTLVVLYQECHNFVIVYFIAVSIVCIILEAANLCVPIVAINNIFLG